MYAQTASIGKSVLISSLFLQKNHIEYNNCKICYINEKNKYGERKLLKRNALLLFMLLHFIGPDKNGLVELDIESASEQLCCTERSIKNNLQLLEDHGYIAYNKTFCPGFYSVFILEYKSYFKKANQGGRGYVVLSKSIFDELLKIKDINTLRLTIRSVFQEITNQKEIRKSFQELKRYLPGYCTKEKIKKIISTDPFHKLFYTSLKKRYILIAAKKEFNASSINNSLKNECKTEILKKITQINAFAKQNNLRFKFHLTDQQLIDLSNISLRVPILHIIDALDEVYRNYISKNQQIHNIGALVRRISEYNAEISVLS